MYCISVNHEQKKIGDFVTGSYKPERGKLSHHVLGNNYLTLKELQEKAKLQLNVKRCI